MHGSFVDVLCFTIMATNPSTDPIIPGPDIIEPGSPPETPAMPEPLESPPDQPGGPGEIEEPAPDFDQPEPGIPETPGF